MKQTKKGSNFQIVQMGDAEKQELLSWEEKYGKHPNFSGIKDFILEGDAYRSLAEMILVNYEIYPIGDEERLLSFVAKNDSNEVIAWFLCQVFKTDPTKDAISRAFDEEPSTGDFFTKKDNEIYSMFMKYLVVNPLQQGKGLGPQIAKEMIFNAKKHIGVQPEEFFGLIHVNNFNSQKVFLNLGFEFSIVENDKRMLSAHAMLPDLQRRNGITMPHQPQQFGE